MIVTISASYGAGGSALAPRIAERLGLPFVDRVVPVDVAAGLGMTGEEAEAVEQGSSSRLWEVLASMSPLAGVAVPTTVGGTPAERELVAAMEESLRHTADGGGGVVLGHGAAVVLAGRDDALHVRLDGAPEGRVRAAMRQHGIDADEAEARRKENDRVRSGYVRRFYHRDSASAELYDLVIDSVRLGWELTEELIVQAATATG